jgi:hypothetical protein
VTADPADVKTVRWGKKKGGCPSPRRRRNRMRGNARYEVTRYLPPERFNCTPAVIFLVDNPIFESRTEKLNATETERDTRRFYFTRAIKRTLPILLNGFDIAPFHRIADFSFTFIPDWIAYRSSICTGGDNDFSADRILTIRRPRVQRRSRF